MVFNCFPKVAREREGCQTLTVKVLESKERGEASPHRAIAMIIGPRDGDGPYPKKEAVFRDALGAPSKMPSAVVS